MESKKRSRNNQRPSLQRGRGSTWNERKEEEKGGNKLPGTKSDNTRDGLVGRGQGDFRMTERWKKVSKRRGREVEERRDTNKRVTRVARDAPSGYVKRLEGEGGDLWWRRPRGGEGLLDQNPGRPPLVVPRSVSSAPVGPCRRRGRADRGESRVLGGWNGP